MIYHCLFEQSGTFKNEFIKLGYKAYDYDILNNFGETDFQIDLFKEIENAYIGKKSIFDNFYEDNDFLLAFFPCTRFESQIELHFRGKAKQQLNWSLEKKFQYCLKLHKELSKLYELVTKLVIICIRKKISLILENPYSTSHYLVRYWPVSYTILDNNRTQRGDYFVKPTQYWFFNCELKNNLIIEALFYVKHKTISGTSNILERSLIHSQYANRFIREFILDSD